MTIADLIEQLAALYVLIRRFEGCRLMPYYCPAGVLTCGWGSTGWGIIPGRAWTQEYADQRMREDAIRFARGTLALCPRLRGKPLCGVSDFSYNLGLTRLKNSTLRRKINAGDINGAIVEMMKWTRGGGKVLRGLVIRRSADAACLREAA